MLLVSGQKEVECSGGKRRRGIDGMQQRMLWKNAPLGLCSLDIFHLVHTFSFASKKHRKLVISTMKEKMKWHPHMALLSFPFPPLPDKNLLPSAPQHDPG